MPRLSAICVLFLALSLAGCASSGFGPDRAGGATQAGVLPLEFAPDGKLAATAPAAAMSQERASASTGLQVVNAAATQIPTSDDLTGYRIAPLDELTIAVFGVPSLGGTMRVGADGTIDLPLVGSVPASGKSLDELKMDLTRILGAKYLQSPQVTVSVKDAFSQRVTVGGAIGKPGVYQTNGPSTLMQIIAMAGGLGATADPRGVLVFRQTLGKRQVAKFDYQAVQRGKSDDPVILAGDLVMVDESGMKASMRNIRESLGLFGLFAPIVGMM